MKNHQQQPNKKIFIVAGEASGDLLGARLATALYHINPSLKLSGMGGQQMQSAGVDIKIDADQLAVVGFTEIIKNLKPIRHAFQTIKQIIQKDPPDLVILIDYPGFNLRLARLIKKAGIKVMYYVSPQIWAWRYHRIKKIKQYIDHMAVLFPFEKQIYQKENIPVSFVGHPLAEFKKPSCQKEAIYQQLGFDSTKPIVILCPGSRNQEVKRLLPTLIACIPFIQAKVPDAQFALPLAKSLSAQQLKKQLPQSIRLIENNLSNLLAIADVAICVSGTITLEIALANVPLVIFYQMSPLTAFIAKKVVKLPYFGLCNIIAEKFVAKEFFQQEATPENIANETIQLLTNQSYRQSVQNELKQLPIKLGAKDAANKAANVVLQLLTH